jgi:hypothetical protein
VTRPCRARPAAAFDETLGDDDADRGDDEAAERQPGHRGELPVLDVEEHGADDGDEREEYRERVPGVLQERVVVVLVAGHDVLPSMWGVCPGQRS